MDRKLRTLFEFQKFEQEPHLAQLIRQAEDRGTRALTDEELGLINAAGIPDMTDPEKKDGN